MNRAVVLIVCLLGAAGIAAYSHGQRDMGGEQADVYVVPQRSTPTAKPSSETAAPPKTFETPADRVTLIRSLQFELKRVGCYSGEINGVWTTSSRMAMKSFTDKVNASLPIDNPDFVLLSLVKGHQDQACPGGTTRSAKAEAKSDEADGATGALVAGGAAAAAAAMAASKPDAKAESRPRNVATVPPPDGLAAPGKGAQQDAAAKSGGPVPPEGVKAKSKQAKKSNSQQPKFVRDFLRTFGIK